MKAFEKAKLALRKYIKENPEKVKKDIEEMRKLSTGKDIYWYLNGGK